MTDTLLVDSTDLRTAVTSGTRRSLQFFDDALASPVVRGDNIVIPYANGELATEKYVAARDYGLGVLVVASSTPDLNAEIDAVYATLPDLTVLGDHVVTLTERRTYPSGVVDRTAQAEYVGGVAPARSGFSARLTLRFRLVDGVFA